MKTKEVLKILRISRATLYRYIQNGTLKAIKMPNGYYDFDDNTVYSLLNKDLPRKNYIYARVSTYKQKNNLKNQIELLKNFCFQNGININGIYQDIASGINFEKRNEFFQLLDEILDYKVNKIIISYKDRLSRIGFNLFYYLFQKFGTKIIVISEIGNEKLDSEEIFEEIVTLLHCYSMKLYSKRKKKIIEDLIKPNEIN